MAACHHLIPPVGRLPRLASAMSPIGQIPLGPVARNFLVANVTRKSPTSYRLVTRKSSVSPACYEEVNNVTRKLWGTGPSGIWPYWSIGAPGCGITFALGMFAAFRLWIVDGSCVFFTHVIRCNIQLCSQAAWHACPYCIAKVDCLLLFTGL